MVAMSIRLGISACRAAAGDSATVNGGTVWKDRAIRFISAPSLDDAVQYRVGRFGSETGQNFAQSVWVLWRKGA